MTRTEQSSVPRKFLVCDWNNCEDENDQKHWVPDPVAGALRAFLECKTTWKETKNGQEPDLVIVVLRQSDNVLTLADLAVFRSGLSKKCKKVLYVHICAQGSLNDGPVLDWLFLVRSCACPIEKIPDWLEYPVRDDVEYPDPFDLDSAQDTLRKKGDLQKRKKPSLEALLDNLRDKKNLRIARTGTGFILMRENSNAKFFYGLVRVCGGYDYLEHDINAKLADQSELTYEHKQDELIKKRFMDVCYDLHNALTARYAVPMPKEGAKRQVVLLIDDKPDKFAGELDKIFKIYLPAFDLRVWNPDKQPKDKKKPLTRWDVEHYSSLMREIKGRLFGKIAISKWSSEEDKKKLIEAGDIEFSSVLSRTCCILVDILFQDAFGRDVEAGYSIIRGIQRICRDYREEIEKNKTHEDKQDPKGVEAGDVRRTEWSLPEIVAISRANDLNKAHTVYRHGAGGYVLKDRLLALPAVIARNLPAALKPPNTFHRNFRQLYNLHHETIGLLRAAVIPRIPFHLNCLTKQKQKQQATSMARLIASLPKTDLHVHPGSCMTPEFLVVASLVMLLRHNPNSDDNKECKTFEKLKKAIPLLSAFWNGGQFLLDDDLVVDRNSITIGFNWESSGIKEASIQVREELKSQIKIGEQNRKDGSDPTIEARYRKLRSVLHKALGLSDHHNEEHVISALEKKPDAAIFFFALSHAGPEGKALVEDQDDLLRLFVLWLAAKKQKAELEFLRWDVQNVMLHDWFRDGYVNEEHWAKLHKIFYNKEGGKGVSTDEFRSNNWSLPSNKMFNNVVVDLDLDFRCDEDEKDFLADCPSKDEHPIAWLLASGTRSSNLLEYLEGCEYSGSEYVRHPFLIHLFAQQTLHSFVRQGIVYAELRCAIGGYENKDIRFSFADACVCLSKAFADAQGLVLKQWQEQRQDEGLHWLWHRHSPYPLSALFSRLTSPTAYRHLPCKVSIILTGKRHKPTRLLLREAGAGAVLYARPIDPATNAREFTERSVPECRVVGFDLAGHEDDHHPQHFRSEYEQVAKMHIPITVHAGENAPADFVESAILDLRARRIGHGLTLADDTQLMDRARDERICVELCPVSNFQTNAIAPHEEAGSGREYPLRKFLNNGNVVCLNTDNPIISYTNMVKECFQASYAYGEPGLSIWELLRIIRMGFAHAFLTLPERRALLELADQLLFDLFTDTDVLFDLRIMASLR